MDGDTAGHYESWFQRANHPDRPLAYWIRYTVFIPKGSPTDAAGELWGVWFDGETNTTVVAYQEFPWDDCSFSRNGFDVRVGPARLNDSGLEGAVAGERSELEWSLAYQGDEPPLLLLPESMYAGRFPKAKALVGSPNARFDGTVTVDGRAYAIDGWQGSQNHNWGVKHTDRYAWGQVAGFDNDMTAFLECATARLKLGPLWTPRFTLVILRYQGREFALNTLRQGLRADGNFDGPHWRFSSQKDDVRISGSIEAPAEGFAVLSYRNPPGGTKTCVNSKIASCSITLERAGHAPVDLTTTSRAAFELIADGSHS